MANEILVLNDENKLELTEGFRNLIIDIETKKKAIDEQEQTIRDLLNTAMKENNLASVEIPGYVISFTPDGVREKFEKAKFREDHEDLYNDYVSFSSVESYVKISPKRKKKEK